MVAPKLGSVVGLSVANSKQFQIQLRLGSLRIYSGPVIEGVEPVCAPGVRTRSQARRFRPTTLPLAPTGQHCGPCRYQFGSLISTRPNPCKAGGSPSLLPVA